MAIDKFDAYQDDLKYFENNMFTTNSIHVHPLLNL
jgi:hypothetical protein